MVNYFHDLGFVLYCVTFTIWPLYKYEIFASSWCII